MQAPERRVYASCAFAGGKGTGRTSSPRRPAGTRNKLSEDFVTALYADFEANGAAAIKSAREENPAAYLRLVAGLVSVAPTAIAGVA